MREIGLQHLDRLTDDFSIWQHTRSDEIDRAHGYALDDAARGLLAALVYDDHDKILIYKNFLKKAIGGNRPIIFFDHNREPLPIECSEDALGEAYWALAESKKANLLSADDEELLNSAGKYAEKMTSIRGRSYSILGALEHNPELARRFAKSISSLTVNNSSAEWCWPEDMLTYGNAIIPYSLLRAANKFNDDELKNVALSMITFLNKETKVEGRPIAIGNMGWHQKGGQKALSSQQPIDPAYQVLANVEAWKLSNNEEFIDEACSYFSWFWGNNIIGESLINIKRESVYDSLEKRENQGAENIVCYLLAQKTISPYLSSKSEIKISKSKNKNL